MKKQKNKNKKKKTRSAGIPLHLTVLLLLLALARAQEESVPDAAVNEDSAASDTFESLEEPVIATVRTSASPSRPGLASGSRPIAIPVAKHPGEAICLADLMASAFNSGIP